MRKTEPQVKLPEVKMIKIDQLKPYVYNTKEHPTEQVQKIINSIEKFGFRIPLLIDKKTMEIISGHGRLLAATKLELTELPCIFADDMTEEEVIAYRIADNRVGESTMDVKLLLHEFEILTAKNFDIESTGFTLPEIEDLKFLRDYGEVPEKPEEKLREPRNITCPECGHNFTIDK